MSTALHDLASAAFVASGLNPDTQTTSPTGGAIDMISADGPCFAVQHVGAFSADTTLAGRHRAVGRPAPPAGPRSPAPRSRT